MTEKRHGPADELQAIAAELDRRHADADQRAAGLAQLLAELLRDRTGFFSVEVLAEHPDTVAFEYAGQLYFLPVEPA